jgi:dihydrofolate reductase
MRKMIAAMKISADSKVAGPEGYADWVEAWSEDYGLTRDIDACLLGAGMYPGYEGYWSAVRDKPDEPLPMTGKFPTAGEIAWSRFASATPHYVLSKSLNDAQWENTHFLRSVADVEALKRMEGKQIYLMGGARLTAALIDAGLVDELRLIVHPLIAGGGPALFAESGKRRGLFLRQAEPLSGGKVSLIYGIEETAK